MKKNSSSISIIIMIFFSLFACKSNNEEMPVIIPTDTTEEIVDLPTRPGPRPATTPNIPHHQIDVEVVPEVHEEMIKRIYAISGIEEQPSVVLSWRGIWLEQNLTIVNAESFTKIGV